MRIVDGCFGRLVGSLMWSIVILLGLRWGCNIDILIYWYAGILVCWYANMLIC